MTSIGLRLCFTASFSVIEAGSNEGTGERGNALDSEQQTTASNFHRMGIFLDIDEPYTRRLIERAFRHSSRARHFQVFLGPGVGMEAIPLPPYCHFQWSEYERIPWRSAHGQKARSVVLLHTERDQPQGSTCALHASSCMQESNEYIETSNTTDVSAGLLVRVGVNGQWSNDVQPRRTGRCRG
jgi:hypothetical protein